MGKRLQAELRQNKPFASLAEEAGLNVQRTADWFRRSLVHTLKPFGITPTQFNSLRILRGARPNGVTCSELGQRLVSSDPDITRLLERLARQGFISRERGCDRRVIMIRIDAKGLELLEKLDPITDELVRGTFAHMRDDQLQTLIDLLEEARRPFLSGQCPDAKSDVA